MMSKPSQQSPQNNTSKKDLTALMIEKNPCGICRVFGFPICKGHVSGSGGGGDGGSNSGSHSSNEENSLKATSAADLSASNVPAFFNNSEKVKPLFERRNEAHSNDKTFDIEVIISLLEKKFLSIENNSELGILRINFNLTFYPLLSDHEKSELNKFLAVVQEEFNEFININAISSEDCSILLENKNNILSLTISIKNPNLYDAFIEHLTSNFIASFAHKKTNESQEENTDKMIKNSYLPNPFDITNGPST